MRIPFKVSTTTSNFMIGVTAAASAGIYLKRGYIDPGLSMPVVLGVLIGAFLGSKILFKVKSSTLNGIRIMLSIAITFKAPEPIPNNPDIIPAMFMVIKPPPTFVLVNFFA